MINRTAEGTIIAFFISHVVYNFFSSLLFQLQTLFDLSFSFFLNAQTNSSSLRFSITYAHGLVFLTFLITKISSQQFGVKHFPKMFSYFNLPTGSTTSNLESFSLFATPQSIYVLTVHQDASFWLCYVMYCYIHQLFHLIYQYNKSFPFFSFRGTTREYLL